MASFVMTSKDSAARLMCSALRSKPLAERCYTVDIHSDHVTQTVSAGCEVNAVRGSVRSYHGRLLLHAGCGASRAGDLYAPI